MKFQKVFGGAFSLSELFDRFKIASAMSKAARNRKNSRMIKPTISNAMIATSSLLQVLPKASHREH